MRKNTANENSINSIFDGERKLSTLINNLTGIVYRCKNDEYWTMQYMSSGAKNITGYSPEDFINNNQKTYNDVIHPDDRKFVRVKVEKALEEKGQFDINYRIIDKSGKLKWVNEKGVGVFEDEKLLFIEGFINDITELIEAKEEAEKSDRLKSEFLAQVSHEIRTPLHIIINYISMHKKKFSEQNDSEIQEELESLELAGNRITRTIDLILNLSQVESGNYKPLKKYHNIDKILNEIYNEYKKMTDFKNLKFELIIDSNETKALVDEYSTKQIFANLVDNAVKYTEQGLIQIKIYKDEKSNNLAVSVLDTGIGISNEFLNQVIKPFTQEQSGYTRKFEGIGLGMALVQKYCEINNFKLEIESEKNKRSKFTVIFNR